jgi:xylan 1,4-beta-xylosidase
MKSVISPPRHVAGIGLALAAVTSLLGCYNSLDLNSVKCRPARKPSCPSGYQCIVTTDPNMGICRVVDASVTLPADGPMSGDGMGETAGPVQDGAGQSTDGKGDGRGPSSIDTGELDVLTPEPDAPQIVDGSDNQNLDAPGAGGVGGTGGSDAGAATGGKTGTADAAATGGTGAGGSTGSGFLDAMPDSPQVDAPIGSGGSSTGGTQSSGGTSGTGGVTTGGSLGSAGSTATAGTLSSGGTSAGGATTGGASSTGGTSGSGGAAGATKPACGPSLATNSAPSTTEVSITVDASAQVSGNPRFWSASVGTGRASYTLRPDLQTQHKIANRELGMQRVRAHGVLSDDMGIYQSAGVYDWTKFDQYLDAIVAAGMRPIMELDYMPSALGTLSSPAEFSPPGDPAVWKAFITAVAQHCVAKYGIDDVSTWYWEVWSEPDYPGYWNATMTAYYTLYDDTVAALTAVLPNAIVGGPASTDNTKITGFLDHCKSQGTRVSFVSSHCYPGGSSSSPSADAAAIVNDNNARVSRIASAGYAAGTIKSFNTEWSTSYSGQGGAVGPVVESMDSHVNAAFVLKTVKLLADKNVGDTPAADLLSYWALSDIIDGYAGGSYILSKGGTLPFGGVFGLMTFQGVRKGTFNGFKMLNYLGSKRLQASGGTASDGVDSMATMSAEGDEVQVIVYNTYKTIKTNGADKVVLNVNSLPSSWIGKPVTLTAFAVDEYHSNPYKIWLDQGKPSAPDETQWQALRAAQHLALVQPVCQTSTAGSYTTSFTLPRQGAVLVILGLHRPVTGRNALVEIEAEDYDGQTGASKEASDDQDMGQSIAAASGSSVYFENVDYSDSGVGRVQLRVMASSAATLTLRADGQNGPLLGTCNIAPTGSAWATQTCTLDHAVSGMSRLYLAFGAGMRLNWLKFQP